jgi:hypothetical protein
MYSVQTLRLKLIVMPPPLLDQTVQLLAQDIRST